MKKVQIDKFGDYEINFTIRHFFHKNIDWLHPKPLYLTTIAFLALWSFFSLDALKLFIPLSIVYGYLYYTAKRLKLNLVVQREFPLRSKEEKQEVIHYNILNPNPTPISNILLFDQVMAHRNNKKSNAVSLFLDSVKAHEHYSAPFYLSMNNGMGKKPIGPLVTMMTDDLGINRITYVDDLQRSIKVYPKVYPTKSPKMLADLLNLDFGEFDSFKKGNNVNFYSTKEYQEGDNVNRINWKLSLKSNNIIVNEFENNTNCTFYNIIIDDDRLNFGEGKTASFEYAKDLALSLLHANVRSNNSMGLITHDQFIQAKSGKQHLTALELFIANLELKKFNKHTIYGGGKALALVDVSKLERKIKFYTNEESNLYLFTGLVSGKLWNMYLDSFVELSRHCKKLHLIIVYGYKEMMKEAGDFDRSWMAKMSHGAIEAIEETRIRCDQAGISYSLIEIDSKKPYRQIVKEGFKPARRLRNSE